MYRHFLLCKYLNTLKYINFILMGVKNMITHNCGFCLRCHFIRMFFPEHPILKTNLLHSPSTLLHVFFLPLITIHIIHKCTLMYHTHDLCLLIVCFPPLGCKLHESRDFVSFFAGWQCLGHGYSLSKYLSMINCLEQG